MSYGRYPYGGVAYAASDVTEIPQDQTNPILAIDVAFTTGALEEPAWEPVTTDVRAWDCQRGRNRELERFQPGRATVTLGNLDRQYDSVNADGPHFGDLKPMRRIRIRETFNGVTYPVFDGFADRWQLKYPGVGKDATATVTATDAFKIFARTELGVSVYDNEVLADAPTIYWRLDDTKRGEKDSSLVALNKGSLGPAGNGTYAGPPELGAEGLVVRDPGSSIEIVNSDGVANAPLMGVVLPEASFDLVGGGTDSFVVEAWCIPTRRDASDLWLWDWADTEAFVLYEATENFFFAVTGATSGQVTVSSGSAPLFARYHVVARYVNGQPLRLWVNGTLTSGGTPSGAVANNDPFRVGFIPLSPFFNWYGNASHVSIYTDTAASSVDQAWVDRHYAAGAAPWQGDLPGARLDRVLDEAEWLPAARELDAGAETLQSAAISTHDVLEHSQKVAETEYGLLFIDRAGAVRFIDKAGLAARTMGPDVYGDDTGEIGYRDLVPDDGDQTIRNRATISRLTGVAKTAEDTASVDEHGRFDYVLEGLLHQSDAWSQTYADAIVDEHAEPRRRIAGLALGPASPDTVATLYPAMLGHELGDYITVRHRPPGGGDLFAQACVIEGVQHAATPKMRTTTWILSPAPDGVEPVPVGVLLQAEDGETLETEGGDEIEVDE